MNISDVTSMRTNTTVFYTERFCQNLWETERYSLYHTGSKGSTDLDSELMNSVEDLIVPYRTKGTVRNRLPVNQNEFCNIGLICRYIEVPILRTQSS